MRRSASKSWASRNYMSLLDYADYGGRTANRQAVQERLDPFRQTGEELMRCD